MKKISGFLFSWLLLLSSLPVYAQAPPGGGRTCGTNQAREQLIRRFPELQLRMERVRQQVQTYQTSKSGARVTRPVIQIPVVFHVVHNRPEQNITEEQIRSQLAVLNQDYRRRNPDTTGILPAFKQASADTQIQFCLATVDPDGQPTNGITRTATAVSNFQLNDDVKFSSRGGKDAWNTGKYLNIWVCNLEQGLLGHAQWPGSPANIDGVVLLYKAVGKYPANPQADYAFNQGRTATHEIGHWLGLEHTWGPTDASCEDTDGIADTPSQEDANSGCPTGRVTSCNNSTQGGDMYQNYMDYTDDACMHLFTKGQGKYMYDLISTARPGLLTAVVCDFPLRADFSASDTIIVSGSTVQFNDNSIGLRATNWLWTFEGGTPATSTQANPMVTYQNPGFYAVTLTATAPPYSDTNTKPKYMQVTQRDPVLYPNPAEDFFLVNIPANYEPWEVSLLNSVGQIIRSWPARNHLVKLSLAGIPAGIYYVRVVQKNGRAVSKKLVVLR